MQLAVALPTMMILTTSVLHSGGSDLLYKEDKFKGSKIALLPDIKVKYTSGKEWVDSISIGVAGFVDPKSGTTYGIRIFFAGEKWIFMRADQPLILLVDGQKREFKGSVDSSRDVSGQVVTETMIYECSRVDLESLAAAKKVEGQINGKSRTIEFLTEEKFLKEIQGFLDKTKAWPSTTPDANAKSGE